MTQDGAIEAHLDHLWMQRGLSRATLAGYRRDLKGFAGWLQRDLASASEADLQEYLASRLAEHRSPRSVARFLSAARGFYRHALDAGSLQVDPTANLSSPLLGRPLPGSLTEDEVERLLGAPRSDDPKGQPVGFRDRTMLETLYATGTEGIGAGVAESHLPQPATRYRSK